MNRLVLKSALALGLGALCVGAVAGKAEARPARHLVKVCRRSSGTAGLVAGGATGALVGKGLIGGPVGIVAGAVGGAFAGRAVDRGLTAKRRCHYVYARR